MFKFNGHNTYMGNYEDIHRAASVYDMANIQLKCVEAATNFDYNKA
jgi:hypothetical protein